jgi:tetratricopeptide (TPR) repeat protein
MALCRVKLSYQSAILTVLILVTGSACAAGAGQVNLAEQQLKQRIALEVEAAREQEQSGVEPLKLGRLWAQLASDYESEAEYAKSEGAYNRALRYLEASPEKIDYAVVLDNLGSLYVLLRNYDSAERCRKHALAVQEAIGNKLEIARGEALLAEVHLGVHKYKEARREALDGYTGMVALRDPDTSQVLSTLVTLIYSECSMGDCASALKHAREARSLADGAFAADSLEVGQSHLALGFAEWKNGIEDGPDEEMRAGIEIMRLRTSAGHPYVLSALEQYRRYLESVHRKDEAREIAQEVAQSQGVGKKPCSTCTVSVYGLAQ